MIAGSGGQGILFLGKLICQAAMIQGKNVTWFPSYGAEMRGGTANCTIVISDDLIGSPIVKNPDAMIILNAASLKRFLPRVKTNGQLYYDSSLISDIVKRDDISIHAVPSSRIAADIGNPRLSNMVLLGAFVKMSELLSFQSVQDAIYMTVPPGKTTLIEKNLHAIRKGSDIAEI
jgi:2-oxoglutarate ferredoxin oxidoreductase subunit gamma